MKQPFMLYCLCLIILLSSFPASAASAPSAYLDTDTLFTAQDLETNVDTSQAVPIILEGTSAQCNGNGVSILGSTITITKEGIYLISGSLVDGQIIIDSEKHSEIQLILNNANITSTTSAPIEIQKAGQVFLTLAKGSQNTLRNSGSYPEDSNVDSVIFSKSDLTLNGSGKLAVQAIAGHGIVSKKALKICCATIAIDAAENGISGKDYVGICKTNLIIHSGNDGIRAKNTDDSSAGNLCITDTVLHIESSGDGLSATGNVQLDGGSFEIVTGGGSDNGNMKPSDAVSPFGGRGGFPFENTASESDNTPSAKGIKAAGSILLSSGSFQLDCADDAIHAKADVFIEGGNFTIRTADDAIHAGASLNIQDGSFAISYCYEGLEGETVTIDGGTFEIISTDDGINAAGGSNNSENWGGFRGESNASITINGGNITIVSDGDSIDSNGAITINGGTLNLTCNGNGNTAIDYETEFQNNGAGIVTNDGSEKGGGMMFGFGGRGQFGRNGFEDRGQRPDGMGPHPDGFGDGERFPEPPENNRNFFGSRQ